MGIEYNLGRVLEPLIIEIELLDKDVFSLRRPTGCTSGLKLVFRQHKESSTTSVSRPRLTLMVD